MAHLVAVDALDVDGQPHGSGGRPGDSGRLNELADYRNLTDVALRRRREPELGLFLAEGSKVISRALAAGYQPRSALASPRWSDEVLTLLDAHDVAVFVAAPDVLREVTGYHVHRGALASMHRRPLPTLAAVVEPARRLLVLEGVVEHTNVGAMFRSAAALGVDAVLLDPTSADPLYRRSVKVSMGAVFDIPWTTTDTWPQPLAELAERGFVTWALTPDPRAQSLDEAVRDLPERLALVVGTEGDGLSRRALAGVDGHVRIPMAAGIDSLNVAAAAAVACWAVRR
jgi:tRNA G18 (ribose-2'-O)-methylase SpoU